MASEFKKINDKKMTPGVYRELRMVFRQIITNIHCEVEPVVNSCVISLRKMLYLRIFVD